MALTSSLPAPSTDHFCSILYYLPVLGGRCYTPPAPQKEQSMKCKTNNSESTNSSPKHRFTETPKHQNTEAPRFALRKGLGLWELTFAGQSAAFKHEQGALYVAYLLLNPPREPIHALDLATRLAAADQAKGGITAIMDPNTGHAVQLDRNSRIQERSLGLEEAETMRATLRSQNQLEALLEDELQFEPVREELFRELIELYDYETNHGLRVRDCARKAADAVGRAIKRFHQHIWPPPRVQMVSHIQCSAPSPIT